MGIGCPAFSVYSIGNGQVAVVVAGEDYKVFDTPADVKQYIESVLETEPKMDDKVSCPACGSYAVTPTTPPDEMEQCEYRCDDCGEYFVEKAVPDEESDNLD